MMKIQIDSADLVLSDDELYRKIITDYLEKDPNCHVGILADQCHAEINKVRGRKLCFQCNGSGNMLFSMFMKCTKCYGKGF